MNFQETKNSHVLALWSYEYMKIMHENCGVKNYMREDHRSYKRNFCSWEKKAWKKLGLYGIRTLCLCDTGAALYQLSQQANCEQVVELVRYKPVKVWWWGYEYMEIIHENCGVKNYMKEDLRSYKRNVVSIMLSWFSNRTGTSFDDGARKSNKWHDQWPSEKLGTASLV